MTEDVNSFLQDVHQGNITSLEQINFVEKITDQFNQEKLHFLIDDISGFRSKKKLEILLNYKEVKKSKKYKYLIKKQKNIPFLDIYEGIESIGETFKLSQDFYDLEGEKHLKMFYPKEFFNIDRLAENLKKNYLNNSDIKQEKTPTPSGLSSPLTWNGSELEFTELIKALIESGKILPRNKDKLVFQEFEKLLNFQVNKTPRLTSIKNRKKEITPFLADLQIHLENWAHKD